MRHSCDTKCFDNRLPTFRLYQSDFDSGTYRIKNGCNIVLMEDICFDPIPKLEMSRTDKPALGWFAAITVETMESVNINLNTYTLECSQSFVDHHYFKAFAIILLNNSPYGSTPVYNSSPGNTFPGDTTPVSAWNTTICNGTIGRSPHFGVKGFYNKNITLYKLKIKDFELAGVWIAAYENLKFHKIFMTGNTHKIRVSARLTSLFILRHVIQELLAGVIPLSPPIIAQLNAQLIVINGLFEARKIYDFENYTVYPPHTVYGMLLLNGARAPFPTIVPKVLCPVISEISNSMPEIYPNANAIIKNVVINNLVNNQQEEISLAVSVALSPVQPAGSRVAVLFLSLFGQIPFNEFFDSNGNVSLTPYLRAYLFTISVLQTNGFPIVIPQQFLDDVLNNNVFDSNLVQPFFGTTRSEDINRGIFGIATYCSSNISIKNVKMNCCQTKGLPNIVPTPENIPGLSLYNGMTFTPNGNNNIWGVFVDGSSYVDIDNIEVSDFKSVFAETFGVHFSSTVTDSRVNNIKVNKLITKADIGNDPIFNPVPTTYGVLVSDNSSNNVISCCDINRIKAKRTAVGVQIENGCSNIIVDSVKAEEIIANSKLLITQAVAGQTINDVPKTASGFVSSGSNGTVFRCIEAKNIKITNECPFAGPTNSLASGISITDGDTGAQIICPKISCLYPGAGKAESIHIEPGSSVASI